MAGSMRKRGKESWELRVFVGRDPETDRRQYLTRTVPPTREAVARRHDGEALGCRGMLNAERSFRRVKGCQELRKIVEALRRHIDLAVTPSGDNERVA